MTIALSGRAREQLHPATWASGLLAAVLAAAGAIHLALMPEHLAESTVVGLGFWAAGIVQLALAGLVLVRPMRIVFTAVIIVSLALMGLYAYNVFIGLPSQASAASAESEGDRDADHHGPGGVPSAGHGHDEGTADHHENGLVLGAGEPVDAWGAGTQAAQIAAVALAVYVLMRARARADGQRQTT